MINKKAKGSVAERELIHMFWDNNWAAIRSAGSGSQQFPSPDVLAGKGNRKIAIEAKSIGSSIKYLTEKEILELKEFCELFGAESWVGIRFSQKKWFFIMLEDLHITKGENYRIDKKIAEMKGLTFKELIK